MRLFFFISSFLLILKFLQVSRGVMIPLVISLFLWYLIDAVARGYQRLITKLAANYKMTSGVLADKHTRILGVITAIVTAGALFWFPIELSRVTIPKVIKSAPAYQERFDQKVAKLQETLNLKEGSLLNSFIPQNFDYGHYVRTIAGGIAGGVASLTGNILIIFIYVIFLFLEQGSFGGKIKKIFLSSEQQNRFNTVLDHIGGRIQSYLLVKTLVSLITGVLSYAVIKVIGVDFPEFWGALIFILNYIPNIGSIVAVFFPTLLALVQFDSPIQAITLFALTSSIQFAIGTFLEPRMMGRSLNLSPVILLISLVVWGELWGIVGAFLSVPLMVVTLIICSEFEQTKKIAIILSETGEI